MSNTQENRNENRILARLTAAVLFVLVVGMGYTVSTRVEGAVASPNAAEEQDISEPAFFPSDCTSDGLVFSDCDLEF